MQVLIVGAGPAGSTAAEVASSLGADVVLVDRKAEIGSPVQCGGFLPEVHELSALLPSAKLPKTLVDLPERCILHRTRLQRMYAPSGGAKEFRVDGRVIDRRAYDRHLAQRAARAGARIFPSTRAVYGSYGSEGVSLRGLLKGRFNPDVIIGADGPSSATARTFKSGNEEVGVCLQYEMADVDIDADAAEMFFGTRWAPGGYAWIIPISEDVANVGIGVRTSYLGGLSLRDVLDMFIKEHPVAGKRLEGGDVTAVMRGLVPAGGMPPAIRHENILLAGDAGGHVMATSGGGIPIAAVAGRIAGEVSAGYLRGTASLDDYPSRISGEFGRELQRSVQIRRIVDLAMNSDRLMDTLFSVLEPDAMKSIMRGRIPDALRAARALLSGGLIESP